MLEKGLRTLINQSTTAGQFQEALLLRYHFEHLLQKTSRIR